MGSAAQFQNVPVFLQADASLAIHGITVRLEASLTVIQMIARAVVRMSGTRAMSRLSPLN